MFCVGFNETKNLGGDVKATAIKNTSAKTFISLNYTRHNSTHTIEWHRNRAMSKLFFDSMLPKYTQFQPFLDSQISSPLANQLNNNNPHRDNANQDSNCNNSLPLTTSTSEGSPLTGSERSQNSPPNTAAAIVSSANRMYPYVSNHPSSHTSLSGMPAFSGLEDKSCRYVSFKKTWRAISLQKQKSFHNQRKEKKPNRIEKPSSFFVASSHRIQMHRHFF